MAYPRIFQRIFTNNGGGSKVREDILPATLVKKVNNITPDAVGNVTLPLPTWATIEGKPSNLATTDLVNQTKNNIVASIPTKYTDLVDDRVSINLQQKTLQLKRKDTTQSNIYTGANGELTVDTTAKELRLHDGVTLGGIRIAGYLKTINAISPDINGNIQLSNAAVSGSYNDLLNTPAPYELPQATKTTLGGVKVGNNIALSYGTISVATGSTTALGVLKVGSNLTVSQGTISLAKSNVTSALGYTPYTPAQVDAKDTAIKEQLLGIIEGIDTFLEDKTIPS